MSITTSSPTPVNTFLASLTSSLLAECKPSCSITLQPAYASWSTNSSIPPLATTYLLVNPSNNKTTTSIDCNTQVLSQYYLNRPGGAQKVQGVDENCRLVGSFPNIEQVAGVNTFYTSDATVTYPATYLDIGIRFGAAGIFSTIYPNGSSKCLTARNSYLTGGGKPYTDFLSSTVVTETSVFAKSVTDVTTATLTKTYRLMPQLSTYYPDDIVLQQCGSYVSFETSPNTLTAANYLTSIRTLPAAAPAIPSPPPALPEQPSPPPAQSPNPPPPPAPTPEPGNAPSPPPAALPTPPSGNKPAPVNSNPAPPSQPDQPPSPSPAPGNSPPSLPTDPASPAPSSTPLLLINDQPLLPSTLLTVAGQTLSLLVPGSTDLISAATPEAADAAAPSVVIGTTTVPLSAAPSVLTGIPGLTVGVTGAVITAGAQGTGMAGLGGYIASGIGVGAGSTATATASGSGTGVEEGAGRVNGTSGGTEVFVGMAGRAGAWGWEGAALVLAGSVLVW